MSNSKTRLGRGLGGLISGTSSSKPKAEAEAKAITKTTAPVKKAAAKKQPQRPNQHPSAQLLRTPLAFARLRLNVLSPIPINRGARFILSTSKNSQRVSSPKVYYSPSLSVRKRVNSNSLLANAACMHSDT